MFTEFFTSIIVFLVSALTTLFFTPMVADKMRKRGMVGVDVHKQSKPEVPEMCGIGILVGLVVSILVSLTFLQKYVVDFLTFLSVVLSSGLIGAVDDLKRLGPRIKPLLTAFASLPILLMGAYDARPVLPLVGRIRLTVVYPLLIPFAIAVPSNAVNMMDPLNGVMSGTSSIVVFVLTVSAAILGHWNAVILGAGLLGSLLAFYHYNRFPSRVFPGNVGTLAVGSAIGALVVIGHVEAIGVVAMMPHIMNGFYFLASVGGLYERKQMPVRPIRALSDGRLAANSNPSSPLTLTRTILALGPMKEEEVIRYFFILTAFSGLLAFLTMFMMM
ncbi:MAG: hypothetical protein OEZ25_01730 [Candidatus Bathyarchaeota archaeon]|nr:hypothetical protein [Candidatus Bathyarchaeota archaeon]